MTPINIRVIAATNKNLESLVRAGKFRSDLYYRLYVLQLNLPPLRERQEDIPLLTQSFLRNFQAREGDGCPLELSDGDCRLLQSCPWRGNIRELQNFCERLAVLLPAWRLCIWPDRPSAGECRLSRDAAPVPAADAEGRPYQDRPVL